MNFNGYDGMNCTVALSAREYKVLYETLRRVTESSHKEVAVVMFEAGFNYKAEDVQSIVRQSVLVMQVLAEAIHSQQDEAKKEKEGPADNPDKSKKSFVM